MKRLLISSLFGFMLMSQAKAGSLISVTKSDAVNFALGAALPVGAALVKGLAVANNDYRANKKDHESEGYSLKTHILSSIIETSFFPYKNRQFNYAGDDQTLVRKYEQRFNFQRYANLFTGLISGGAIAAGLLFGTKYMPHCIGKLIGSPSFAKGLLVSGMATLPACLIGL